MTFSREGIRTVVSAAAVHDRALAVDGLRAIHNVGDRCDASHANPATPWPMVVVLYKPLPVVGPLGTYSAFAPDSLTTLAHLTISICW